MNIRLRLLVEWAVVALFSSLTILLALQWRGTAAFDNLVYDQLSSIWRPSADDDILLVSIDDPSLSEIGKWPWPRRTHAELIEKLKPAQPRSILLDILLSEPGEAVDDEALAKAISGSVPVYLPVHFVTPGNDGRAYDTELPTAQLAGGAKGLGHVNVEFDSDGRVRRIALCFQPETGEKKWPHIVEMVARSGGKPTRAFARSVNCGQTLLIPYAKRGSFAEISYTDALKGGIPGGLIKGRDVIVGATAAGSGDSYPAPFSDGGLLSGAEIMANVLAALKRDNFIRAGCRLDCDPAVDHPFACIAARFPEIASAQCLARFIGSSRRHIAGQQRRVICAILVSAGRCADWHIPGLSALGLASITGDERFHGN